MLPRMSMWRAAQVVMVPESVATIASSRQELVQLVRDDLRLHRHVRARAALVASARATPSSPACAFSRNERSLWCVEAAAAAPASDAPRVADQRRPRPGSAGRSASGRGRSARLAPGRAWDRTRCRGSCCRRSAACRSSPAPPATAACRAGRCRRSCRGCRRARTPLPSSALTIGAPSRSATAVELVAARRARRGPARMHDLAARRSGSRPRARAGPRLGTCALCGHQRRRRGPARCASSAGSSLTVLVLDVDRDGDVGDAAVGERRAAGELDDVLRRAPAPMTRAL